MPLHDSMIRVPLAAIWVAPDRQRRGEIKIDDLLPSIARQGVIVPIILEQGTWGPDGLPWKLVVGERRLRASQQLALPDIPARISSLLDPREARIIELAENVKRQDLPWQDLVAAVAEVHSLYETLDAEWTQAETAEHLSITQPLVSRYLAIHREMSLPAVASAGTYMEAYNIIKRKEQRAAGDALQELADFTAQPAPGAIPASAPAPDGQPTHDIKLAPATDPNAPPSSPWPLGPATGQPTITMPRYADVKPYPEVVQVANFLDWAPAYAGARFNLLHLDFPYGVDLFAAADTSQIKKNETYADTAGDYWELVECLTRNLDRFFSLSGHIVFWHSGPQWLRTAGIIEKWHPEIQWVPHPFIWFKSDNAGLVTDVRRRPRHVYETAMLGYRGDRHLVTPKADCYPCPTDNRLHPSAKPEPMLKHLLSMLCDETSSVLDPTCGSGSALRAASALGARQVLGLEVSPEYAERANQAFRNAQLLRAASRGAGVPAPAQQQESA